MFLYRKILNSIDFTKENEISSDAIETSSGPDEVRTSGMQVQQMLQYLLSSKQGNRSLEEL